MWNLSLNSLRRFGYDSAEREVELSHGVNHHELRIRVSVDVTIAGGANNGVVAEDGVARLIRSLRLDHDGFAYVDLTGRDLFHLTRRTYPQVEGMTALANANAQAGTALSLELIVPFSWRFLANPHDLFLPAMPAQNLRLFIQLDDSRTNAGSSQGSGALVTGTADTVTFANFVVEVIEVTSVTPKQPYFIPVLTGTYTEQIAAANAELEYELKNPRRLAAQMFQYRNGAAENVQANAINKASMLIGQTRKINGLSFAALKSMERNNFPAVPAADNATLFFSYLDNGKLGTAFDPRRSGTNPKWIFDVDAPGAAPGRIRVVNFELAVRPGVTVIQTP